VAVKSVFELPENVSSLFSRRRDEALDAGIDLRPAQGAERAGDLLLELRGPDVPLDQVVGEGHLVVEGEGQHRVLVPDQPGQQVPARGGLPPAPAAAPLRGRLQPVRPGAQPVVQGLDGLPVPQPVLARHPEQGQQEPAEGRRPARALLAQGPELPEQVRPAQRVPARREVEVALPAVVHEPAAEEGQDGVRAPHGLPAPLRVREEVGRLRGGGGVQPVQAAPDAHAGLVGVGRGGGRDEPADGLLAPGQQAVAERVGRDGRGLVQGVAEEVPEEVPYPPQGNLVAVVEHHAEGPHPAAVLGRGRHALGEGAPVPPAAAPAGALVEAVLRDLQAGLRQVEDLAPLHELVLMPAHGVPAGAAVDPARLHPVGRGDLLERAALVPRLAAGPAAARPGERWLLGQAVARGRLAAVARVLAQPGLELLVFLPQRGVLPAQGLVLKPQGPVLGL